MPEKICEECGGYDKLCRHCGNLDLDGSNEWQKYARKMVKQGGRITAADVRAINRSHGLTADMIRKENV